MKISKCNPPLDYGHIATHPCLFEDGRFRGMAYRYETQPFNSNSRSVICGCDENWNPIDAGALIQPLPPKNDSGEVISEDCRVFFYKGVGYYHVTNRNKIFIGQLRSNKQAELLIPEPAAAEKNWMFFEHKGQLYGIRWAHPLTVHHIQLDFKEGHKASMWNLEEERWIWDYGVIHGGSSPVAYGDLYVTMVHSFTIGWPNRDGFSEPKEKTDCNEWKVYFAAPLVFAEGGEGRFCTVMVPKYPMIWPALHQKEYRSHNGEFTVFPTGLIREGDNWICSYGDDRDCWKAEFTTEELFTYLTPL